MDTITKIFALLKERGLSQKQFAEYLNVKPQVVSDWKAGRNNSYMGLISKIAQYLGVSTDYLLGNKKNPAESKLDEVRAEIMANAEKLSDADLERLLEYAKLMLDAEKGKR